MHINVINNRQPVGRFASTLQRFNASTSKSAFTLVEVVVVCAILAILAATIIPGILSTSKDAKVSAAKTDISELGSALERFYINMDRYPTSDEGLAVLTDPPSDAGTKWRGPYIKKLRMDPWGNPYQYACPGTHNQSSYDIWSKGLPDGNDKDSGEIGNW